MYKWYPDSAPNNPIAFSNLGNSSALCPLSTPSSPTISGTPGTLSALDDKNLQCFYLQTSVINL